MEEPRSDQSEEVGATIVPRSGESQTTHENLEEAQYLTGTKLYIIFISLGLSVLLMALDVSVIATAIPSITARFHSTADIGWYGAVYSLTLCSLQPLGGKLYTLFSPKRIFLAFIGIFMLGSLLCGLAISSNMFIIGRAVAGAGASGIFSGCLSIIAIVIPLSKRALYNGILGSLFGVATVAGPLIGGVLTTKASWRWCFYMNLPVGAITVASLILLYKPPEREAQSQLTLYEKIWKIDIIGCCMFVPSIVMFLLALQWGGNQHAWRSATIIGLFCGFALLITMFFGWEHYKGDGAMIPFSVLLDRSVILSCLYGFLVFSAFILGVYYIPVYFQVIKGASPLRSGVLLLPSVCSQIFASAVSGLIVNRTGYYNPWFFIGAACISVATGLFTTLKISTPHHIWIPYQVIQGLGSGVAIQMAILAVQAALASRPHLIPIGISLGAFFQYFGSSIAQSIGLAVLQNKLIHGLENDAGLNETQVNALLLAGFAGVGKTTREQFPEKFLAVLIAYDKAVANVFYVPIAATVLAFFLAMGIKWQNIKAKKGSLNAPADEEAGPPPSVEEKATTTMNPEKGGNWGGSEMDSHGQDSNALTQRKDG